MLTGATFRGLILPLLLAGLAACGQSAPEAAAPAFPHEASDLEPDPRVAYGELENGFRYAIMRNATPPGAVSMRLAVQVGSLSETDAERGYAHFLEHMAFNGSENVPEGELIAMLEREGLARGANVNASTSYGATMYLAELPDADAATLDAAFVLFSELDALTLSGEAVERERGVVLAEIRARDTPAERVENARLAFLYPDALIGDRSPGGTAESVASLDVGSLRAFYERYYTPDRAFLSVAGDIDPADIAQRIETAFGDWERPEARAETPDPGEVGFDGPAAGFLLAADAPPEVSLYTVKPSRNAPDTRAERETVLAMTLVHNVLRQRLAAVARAGGPLTAVAARFVEREKTADASAVGAQTRPGEWREAIAALDRELRRMLEFGPTHQELDEQIANMRASLAAAETQADTMPSQLLAQQIAAQFLADHVFMAPSAERALVDEMLGRMTPEMVLTHFRRAWEDAPPTVFVAEATPIDGAETAILAAYTAAMADPVEAPVAAALPPFAHTDFGPAGTVASREADEEIGVVRIRFANNVMLNFKHTEFAAGSVNAMLFFGGGLLATPVERPEERYLLQLLTQGGTTAHPVDELQRLMAGRRVVGEFALSDNTFLTPPMPTVAADLETQLQLWAAFFAAPGFRPEPFARLQQTYAAAEARAEATAASVLARNAESILRQGDFADASPPVERVAMLTPETARGALAEMLGRSAIQIAIVGDITEEEATMAVARTFGALPERDAAPRDPVAGRTAAFPAPQTVRLAHSGPADQAIALIAWPATDGVEAKRARRISVTSQLLQQRVAERLRETMGASYSPRAMASLSRDFPGYGYVAVQMDLKPEDMGAAVAAIEAEAVALAAGEATQDELDRVLQPILESFSGRDQQNLFWAMTIGRAQTRPEDLERAMADPADYPTITLAEITALAAEYLDPAKAVRIEVLSEAAD